VVANLQGPFLFPGSLSRAERLHLIDGLERVLAGVFAHLPLKRARYGSDPIQRLCILRTQIDELSDDAFHYEVADIISRLRDAHTRYAGPPALASKVATLPFLVEMIGSSERPRTSSRKSCLDWTQRSGRAWCSNRGTGCRSISRCCDFSERCVGGRPDTQRAWAVQELTFRALQYGPPPTSTG
jgi:hypothetical protein